MQLNPCNAEYFHVLHSSPIFKLLTPNISDISLYLQAEWKTMWILIRWLRQKPADLDLQCFEKKKKDDKSGFSRSSVNPSKAKTRPLQDPFNIFSSLH